MALEQDPKFIMTFRAMPSSPTWLIHSTFCFLYFGFSFLDPGTHQASYCLRDCASGNALSNLLPIPTSQSDPLSNYIQLIFQVQTFVPFKMFFLTSSSSSPVPCFHIALVMINLKPVFPTRIKPPQRQALYLFWWHCFPLSRAQSIQGIPNKMCQTINTPQGQFSIAGLRRHMPAHTGTHKNITPQK